MTHSFANIMYLSLYMLEICSCFDCRLLIIFFKINFFETKWHRNNIRVSNCLDLGQDHNYVVPDLGLNCLQSLSTDGM